jgi:hypothetical protein
MVRALVPKRRQTLLARLHGQVHHRTLRRWLDDQRPAGAHDWHDPDFF